MGISIAQFRVAMETYGAERLGDHEGTRYSILVPCFAVGDVIFLHSGSYYIVQRGRKVPEEILNKAMAEFGEKYPGGDNFWWGEIHSIKGILTLAAMLDGKYSKELIDKLTNETCKKLLESSLIQKNVEFPFQSSNSPKMEELCKKLAEYSDVVNPFGNDSFDIKEPIEYFDSLNLSISSKEGEKSYAQLTLEGESFKTRYENDFEGWRYNSMISIQKNRKNGCIDVGHYYTNGNNRRHVDEVVYFDYKTNVDSYKQHRNDIDLWISLKSGLAWQNYKEDQAAPVTDEQIDIMITYLDTSIMKIKQEIILYMLNKET